ncbi:hypothetical protein LIER_01063 [Lithospermum erythrorhizon]|uniref:Retrovirus-related Pol polyprotein from transposon TNT 1-94-like beta-barrel domain-containing protein n=1 Tax=Lithospermum erythrorhizon TaxID=34254 RepID=A0AAV3NL31_LITER
MLDRLYVKRLARPIEELCIRPPGANIREWSELDMRGWYQRKAVGHKVGIGNKKHIKTNPGKSKASKKDDQCHYCNKTGHWKSECYAFKSDVANCNVKGDCREARMGNNGVSKIVGIEDVLVPSRLGKELVLKNVRHIPDLSLNLISSGKLDDQGYLNFFGDGQWKLIKDSKLIIKDTKEGILYRSRLETLKDGVHIVDFKLKL